MFDAFKYAYWLQSVALLSSAENASHYDRYVMEVLTNRKTDPRKLISFLMSSDGEELMRRVGPALSGAQNRIDLYAAENAKNLTIQDMVMEVKTKMKSTNH